MANSVERKIKDAITAALETLESVAAVSTSSRGNIIAEGAMTSGTPTVLLNFPPPTRRERCGYVQVVMSVSIQGMFRWDDDPDTVSLDDVRTALDDFEQEIFETMTTDVTWGALAVDTRPVPLKHKFSSEEMHAPEAAITFLYEVEFHLRPDDLAETI